MHKLEKKKNHQPVLDLQQVADEAVAGAALDEVPLGREEGLGGGAAMLLQEVVEQRQLAVLLHLVDGHGVHHRLDHAAVRRQHQDLVGLDPQRHSLHLPHALQRSGRGQGVVLYFHFIHSSFFCSS